ncbi:hypothetical protein Rhein_0849 [Rheinheimera sp. A13L]|uniref:hypothetical protein n=1 Tax=Rheinheimera sp. A13L TaxID=506534 RepID=UPI00021249FA|nr:hypothetical protein [Rheinheimera sp. A13L]EGM78991.1 hypothetical protein Rhein_0849 [Rheinheimera sp. A13L]
MKINFLAGLACCLLLSSCSERRDVDEMTQHFQLHQDKFKQLAAAACSLKATLNTKFHRYDINTAEQYPAELAPLLKQLDQLLADVDKEDMALLQEGTAECSLIVTEWSSFFAGEGAYMAYSYQPAVIAEFNPDIHMEGKRSTTEKIYFTKALAYGWYIEYLKQP